MFMDRQTILQILYDNIKDKSKILPSKRLEKLELGGTEVTATTTDGSKFTGDILVGADGIHSAVRSEMWRLAAIKSPGLISPSEHNG